MKVHHSLVALGVVCLLFTVPVSAEHPTWTKQQFIDNNGMYRQVPETPWQSWESGLDVASSGALNIEYASSFLWTGLGNSVVDGNYGYVASPYGLLVFDISNPSAPEKVTGVYGAVTDLAKQGNYLFAVAGSEMTVFDVSVPDNPFPVTVYDLGVSSSCIAIGGDYAYVGTPFDGLYVVDITSPVTPAFVTSVFLYRVAHDIDIQDTILCVAEEDEGLRVFSIASPASPAQIGLADTPQLATGVDIDGDLVYVSDHYGGAIIMDFTDPTNPVTLSTIATGGKCDAVTGEGTYLYFANGNDGFGVVDVSDPSAPGTPVTFDTGGEVSGITKVGDLVYVCREGLWVINVADPTGPFAEGHWRAPYQVLGVLAQDRMAFVKAGGDGFYIYDLNDPYGPQQLYYNSDYYCFDIAVQGNIACVATNHDGLLIYDISDPSAPVLLSTFAHEEGDNVYTYMVDISGDFAFIGGAYPDFQIIDISDPTNPSYVGGFGESMYWGFELVVEGDLMLVAAADDGVLVIDISDPGNPSLASTIPVGWAEDVDAVGSTVFIADDDNGLYTADLSNPGFPVYLDDLPFDLGCNDVDVEGDYAWITSGISGGFRVVDVSDPSSLFQVDAQPTPGFNRGVSVDHGLVVAADYFAGAVYLTNLYEPPPEEIYTRFGVDAINVFWANAVDPMDLTVYLGNLPDNQSALDIDPASVVFNGTLPAQAYEFTTHPDFDGPVLAVTFGATDVIGLYEPIWGSDPVEYSVSGSYLGGDPFDFTGEVVISGHVPGDVNADGVLDISDIVMLVEWMFQQGNLPRDMIAADLTRDGSVDISDLIQLTVEMF